MNEFIEFSKNQFFLTAGFNLIFVEFNAGISLITAIMYSMRKTIWQRCAKFWLKTILASYSITVITTLLLVFQLATNWSKLGGICGNIFGPFLILIALIMFFCEFLMFLIKLRAEKTKTLWILTILMHLHLWIIIAIQTTMHQPNSSIEFDYMNNCAHIVSFFDISFNFNTAIQFTKSLWKSYSIASIFCIGICARYILQNKHIAFSISSIKTAVLIGGSACISLTPLIYKASSFQMPNIKNIQTINVIHIKNGMLGLQAMRNLKKEYTLAEKEIFLMHKHDIAYANLIPELQPTERLIGTSFETVLPSISEINQEQITQIANEIIPNFKLAFYSNLITIFINILLTIIFFMFAYKLFRKKITSANFTLKCAIVVMPLPFLSAISQYANIEATRGPWLINNMLPIYLAASNLTAISAMISLISMCIFLFICILLFAFRIINIAQDGPENHPISTHNEPKPILKNKLSKILNKKHLAKKN